MADILSRVEDILDAIVNGNEVDFPRPQSRVEKLLWQLIGGVVILDQDGLIPLNVIPKVAFAECVTVENDTARFALTTDDVQNGDTVYVNSTQIMYFVVDETKLNLEAGYKSLAAGIAAQAVGDKNGNDITTTYQTSTLGSWTAGQSTTHVTPAGTDTVLQALQKIDNNQRNDETNISSEQAKTTGMTEGGSNYITVGGIRVYVSATAPTGARTGDLWIGG